MDAPLVYVGERGPEDFARCDVAGKIALVDGIAVEDVADRASHAGAAAEIHVSPTEHLYEMCISPVWGSPSARTRGALSGSAKEWTKVPTRSSWSGPTSAVT